MKTIFYLLTFLAFSSLQAQEAKASVEELLKGGSASIHYIWKEWMEKPKLDYTKLTDETIKPLLGSWAGKFQMDDEELKIVFTLEENGQWSSTADWPELKTGFWYLSDGMILIYDSKISEDSEIVSALTVNGGKLRILFAEVEEGFVEVRKAEQDVPPKSDRAGG